MIFLLDNYDSFTYNLVDYLHQAGAEVIVKRNDKISISDIEDLNPAGIVLSPGPEIPEKAGILMDVVKHFEKKLPMLGICLGLQAIGQFYGADLKKAIQPMHGKISLCNHNKHWLFNKVPNSFEVMRYHSLIIDEVPETILSITASTDEKEIMAISHSELPIQAVQFHPESILTLFGNQIIENWVQSICVV